MIKHRWVMVDKNGEVKFKAEGDEIHCGKWWSDNREHFETKYPDLKLKKETFEEVKVPSLGERLDEIEKKLGIKSVTVAKAEKPGFLSRVFRRRQESDLA